MPQAYQGYFQEGKFISLQKDSIPDFVEVYVIVTSKILPEVETKVQKQRKAFDKFAQAISIAEPLCDEFDEVVSQGIHVLGELKL